MISIDHTLISTEYVDIIELCVQFITNRFRRIKGDVKWKGYHIYSNDAGITCYLQPNRFSEYKKLFIAFSPHKLHNAGIHNANNVTYSMLLLEISKLMVGLGIRRESFCCFKIVSIEIGTNFEVKREPFFILNSALMIGNHFFQRTTYQHYRTAGNRRKSSKYYKAKFYIKSAQTFTNTGLTHSELGYCPKNTMRFEIKLERAGKFTFLDFSNLETLFKDATEEAFKDYLAGEFNKVFFFCLESIDARKLRTKPQLKNYYRFGVDRYWTGLNAGQRSDKKKFYSKLPKLFDPQEEMRNCFPFPCKKKP
ncbi:hypothetical protein EGI11_10705 [Chryseobacterium sp. H3056]|uniref:Uncharacterized protein n=1 Tax=Kaistella daneshvariae TaxID=2487074 RepID=A0A3N0WT51_9FLAO|nr:hypothetical protein [Kaistella daneshvariae]ROI08115.1 hypothetical protein EGI11_10705 [Kaistella daneshvariae]